VTRERQDGENVLALRLRYNVISANVPGNNVLLEGVEQTVRTGVVRTGVVRTGAGPQFYSIVQQWRSLMCDP
jgi:hypothetical protein